MPRPIAFATFIAVLALPLTVVAAPEPYGPDEAPVEEPVPVEEPRPDADPTEAPVAQPDPWTPPATVAPVVVAATPQVDGDPCGGGRWAKSRRMKGRFALGFSKGHLELDDERDAKQKSLLARVALRRGYEIELELSKMELGGDDTRTAGGSLLRAFGNRKLRPYVIAGAGGGRIERADGTEDHLRYAELGGGVMLRKKRLAIGVDFRRGVRHLEGEEVANEPAMDVAGRVTAPSDDDRERYVRGRILALVYF
jgi:hypothetical protein